MKIKSYVALLWLLAIGALSPSAHAQATCPATSCVNVGDPIVFAWALPAGTVPDGYNLISGASVAAVQAAAAANVAAPNFLQVGKVFTYTITATPAMVGTTVWGMTAWNCSLMTPCGISPLSDTVTVQVSAVSLQAVILTVK
jgi:hypothetical protein